MKIVVKKCESLSNEEWSDMYEVTENQYGDPKWLYEPKKSDEALLFKENQTNAFCLYSLVSEGAIDRYNYSDYTDEVSGDVLIINHIIVRSKFQNIGLGKKMMRFLFYNYDHKVLCKAWVPNDGSTHEFFEELGFSALGNCEEPWNEVELNCSGCGQSNGCVCSGVVYAKN